MAAGVAAGGVAGGAPTADAARKVVLAMNAAMTVVRGAFMSGESSSIRARSGIRWRRNAHEYHPIADFSA